MKLLNTKSLAATVDSVNESLFFGKAIPAAEKLKVAKWLVSRQGVKHSYAGLPAPTDMDLNGIKLFTGEAISTRAGTCHILGEEALRILLLFNVKDASIKQAIERANASMVARINKPDAGGYCCGKCSVAMWRTLIAGGLDNQEARLANGLVSLGKYRDGKGRWGHYPFYYTLLALSEMDSRQAIAEMRYAAPVLERMRRAEDIYSLRRQRLAKLVLAKC
jgi:bacterioferritin-associated ferredoxin